MLSFRAPDMDEGEKVAIYTHLRGPPGDVAFEEMADSSSQKAETALALITQCFQNSFSERAPHADDHVLKGSPCTQTTNTL